MTGAHPVALDSGPLFDAFGLDFPLLQRAVVAAPEPPLV
jgi:hypothetical protein